MKKRALFTAVCTILICSVFMLSGCGIFIKQDIKYYSNDENYVTKSSTVESITYYNETLRLEFKEDYHYLIVESNEKILRANDFYVDVRIDSEITYVAGALISPHRATYIVAIEYNGKTYLDFETGKNNLLEHFRGLL